MLAVFVVLLECYYEIWWRPLPGHILIFINNKAFVSRGGAPSVLGQIFVMRSAKMSENRARNRLSFVPSLSLYQSSHVVTNWLYGRKWVIGVQTLKSDWPWRHARSPTENHQIVLAVANVDEVTCVSEDGDLNYRLWSESFDNPTAMISQETRDW